MGAGVIDPSDTGSFMQESTQLEPVKKGGKKKILIAVIAAFFGVSLFLGISLFLKSQKTSAKVLDSFSESTSNLTSEGNDLASAISKTTYGGSSDVGSTNLENDVKAFDEAVAKFEDVTNRLKSDRKTLKGAAQAYISEIKAYKSSVIDLAVDNAKIQALTSSLSSTQFGSNVSNASEFSAEADKASAAYAKAAGELKDLSLSNEKAKELRDLYVAFIGEMQTVIKNLKVAVNAGDRSAILDESSKFSELTRSHPAIAKEDEVREALGVNSEAYEKLEAARAKLNEEISKVRY
jgi:ABC-type transport system involved in cytochrome bd biosynthesis fused ATPase/permease subunit